MEFWTNEEPPFMNKLVVNHALPMLVDGERRSQLPPRTLQPVGHRHHPTVSLPPSHDRVRADHYGEVQKEPGLGSRLGALGVAPAK